MPSEEILDFTVVLSNRNAQTEVQKFAEEHGLHVTSVHHHSVRVQGSANAAANAFAVEFYRTKEDPRVRHYEGKPSLPADVQPHVHGILNLTTAPVAKSHRRTASKAIPLASSGFPQGSFGPRDLAKVYQLPEADGQGQAVGIIELGGGILNSDLKGWFNAQGLHGSPNVVSVGIDGGRNSPGVDADGECILDVDVIAGLVPKATVVVYYSPNTDQGFYHAIRAGIDDPRNLAAISISWGSPEDGSWDAATKNMFDGAFNDAANAGIVVTVASGDNGASDRADDGGSSIDDGQVNVDFPSSSPHVLSVGGTRLVAPDGNLQQEIAWNQLDQGGATGGGISDFFPVPAYQSTVGALPTGIKNPNFQGRGVPDVAAIADPNTAYQVYFRGQRTSIGGTSGAAPLWAAVVVKLAQLLGGRDKLRLFHEVLYANRLTALRDITEGNNRGATTNVGYDCAVGYDAVTGLGVPIGTGLLGAFKGSPQ